MDALSWKLMLMRGPLTYNSKQLHLKLLQRSVRTEMLFLLRLLLLNYRRCPPHLPANGVVPFLFVVLAI